MKKITYLILPLSLIMLGCTTTPINTSQESISLANTDPSDQEKRFLQAIQFNNKQEMLRLLKQGFDIDQVLTANVLPSNLLEDMPQGAPPLIFAARQGYLSGVQFLLEQGANVNIHMPHNYQTALHVTSHLNIANLLIEHRADVNASDKHGITPFQRSISPPGNYALAKKLLNAGAKVDGNGQVHSLTLTEEPGLIMLLLSSGAKAEQAYKLLTTIHDTNLLHQLLEQGLDINQADSKGNTALHNTTQPEKVQWLLRQGINTKVRNRDQETAIILHCKNRAHYVVDLILSSDESEPERLIELLYIAIKNNDLSMLELLIKHKAPLNPEQWGEDGNTPLTYALEQMDTSPIIIKQLLLAGADPSRKNIFGNDVFLLAQRHPDPAMDAILANYR